MKKTADFKSRVAEVVKSIPKGAWLSYGQVALLAGKPGAARAVAKALYTNEKIPWWRVVRANGTIAPSMKVKQTKALARDGVKVKGLKLPRAPKLTAMR